ncbi:MDIS1-interacting receptor like kinase 2 [Dichanthelium oligosanthes]|uniref:non-specific serine/threonine protein kinase n=1 Tax=Dichanthelium oligosanthes TaxID=888268 RepID=A0A1E5W3D8_9POAL|nr:MDIS1-interacting receptor like kinase 2 [Dichanthelium oligosanthes]
MRQDGAEKVPAALGNLTQLNTLYLFANELSGPIPTELGKLINMEILALSRNRFTAGIPVSLSNLTKITTIFLHENQITGFIPPELGKLANLQTLDLRSNKLTAAIPPSLANLTKVTVLFLYENQITGSIPPELGKLVSLQSLDLSSNNLTAAIPVSLGNLTKLTYLSLFENQITGPIPQELGSLPQELGNLTSIVHIDLTNNSLSGVLPANICAGGKLEFFFMVSLNMFNGPIPRSLKTCTTLIRLFLEGNQLTGDISKSFGVYPQLVKMNLKYNRLFGEMTLNWGAYPQLEVLHFSGNMITGKIPPALSKLSNLVELKLNSNNLSGEIHNEIRNLTNLYSLNLSLNQLSGSIPPQLGKLINLGSLDISGNSLSGSIPDELGDCIKLQSLKINNNHFNGSLPGAIGNLRSLQIVLVAIVVCFTILSTIVIIFIHAHNKRKPQEIATTIGRDMFSVWNFDGRLVFDDIVRATENFDNKYIVGTGAHLQDGQIVAVKKLHSTEEVNDETRFHSEMEVLSQIRQRSIVKLYGFCSHPEYKFLVYNYIERGSLHMTLQNEEVAREFDWQKRSALVHDVAQAIAYLHYECNPPIIHRDITSNNILLDTSFKAYVSDFSTARILKPDSSNWRALAGTYSHMAPGTYFLFSH